MIAAKVSAVTGSPVYPPTETMRTQVMKREICSGGLHLKTMGSLLALAVALAADELLDAAVGFVVGHLHGRMLGEVGGGGMEHPANAAIEREFAAANRVNYDAGGIR